MGIFEFQGKRYKVVNRMFMDAEYSFSMLKFYYGGMTNLLRSRADDFHKYTDELAEEHKKRQQQFDKEYWLKHYDVFSGVYPQIFNNAFIVSTCALYESQIKKLCELIAEQHKVPLIWDDMKGSVPTRAKSFLWDCGILLIDDPPKVVVSPPYFIPTEIADEKRVIAEKLWQDLENYFRVRNCIAHHGGSISRMRYQTRTYEYASSKGILVENNGQKELRLNHDFNNEVCDTMMKFFGKVTGAYYSAPLPG